MGQSRRLGFIGVRDTESSFSELFERLRAERIVPVSGSRTGDGG